MLLENGWPYQRANVVIAPFAGYVSGHSIFTRATATVLEALTGDAYFPGGLASFTTPADDFVVFELGGLRRRRVAQCFSSAARN